MRLRNIVILYSVVNSSIKIFYKSSVVSEKKFIVQTENYHADHCGILPFDIKSALK